MPRFAPLHSWAAHALLAHVTAFGLLAGLTATPPPPPPAQPPALVMLEGGGATVTTANGQSWVLSVTDIAGQGSDLEILLHRKGAGGAEFHVWQFDSQAGSMTFSAKTKTATVRGGKSTGELASVDLTFRTTATRTLTCGDGLGNATIYTGALSGSAVLRTGLIGAGTVGGTHLKFTAPGGAPEIISSETGCGVFPGADMCTPSRLTEFNVGSDVVGLAGFLPADQALGLPSSLVGLERTVSLPSPRGAVRTDLAAAATRIGWRAKTHVLSVPRLHGLVTGSATLRGGKPTTQTTSCKAGATSHRVTDVSDDSARYRSPAGQRLTAHFTFTAPLRAPAKARQASYIVETVAR